MSATAGDFVAFIRQLANQRSMPVPVEGIVVSGSWKSTDGTVQAVIAHTGALSAPGETIDPNDPDTQIIPDPIPILGNHPFERGGPIGGERIILFPFEDGRSYVGMMMPGGDDGLDVPAGEKHIYLRSNDLALALACFLKVQADAVRIGHRHKVVLDASLINFGIENASDDQGIARKSDLQKAINDMTHYVQQAFNTQCRTLQPGNGVPPPTVEQAVAEASTTTHSV